MDYCREIAWNCGPGNHHVEETLLGWIEEYNPDVLKLSEAAAYWPILRRLPGYDVAQEIPQNLRDRSDDTGDVAILYRVSKDHVLKKSWRSRMRLRWMVLSKRRVHQPHIYENVNLEIRGRLWRHRAMHPPTHGFHGPNAKAFKESAKKTRRWFRRGVGRLSVASGDWNEVLKVLAEWFGKNYKVWGEHIDLSVTRGVKRCTWKKLPKGGSDHFGRLYEYYA